MSISITCPDCRATLKANKPPRPDKLMQCLKCRHHFTMSDSIAASSSTIIIAKPFRSPKASATSRPPRVLLVAVVVLILAVAGSFGAYLAARPAPVPLSPKPLVAEKPPISEPKVETKPELKVDAEFEFRRQQFTQFMIDAGIAAQLRKFDEAVAAYADAARLFPDDADVQRKLVDARAAQEIQRKARQDLEQVKNEAADLLKRGQAAFDKDQLAAAIDLFKLALEKSPTNEEAAQQLLVAQNRLQKIDAEKKSLDDFDRHILAGKAALQAGRPADAIREFVAAGKILPNDPLPPELIKDAEQRVAPVKNQDDRKKQYQALLDQAAGFVKLKKIEDAEDAFRQALKLYPDDTVAQRGLDDLQKTLKWARAEVANLMAQAQNALARGQLPVAMGYLQNAQGILPHSPELLRALRAMELIQLNQAAYFQAINRATAAMALRRYGDALLAYSDALRIVPNDPLATVGLLEAQGGLAVVNRKQLEYDVLVNQGVFFLRNQRYADAARAFEGALRLVHSPLLLDPQVQCLARYSEAMAQAVVAHHNRQFPLAVQFYQIALNEIPNDLAAQSALQKARLGVRI